MHSLCICHGLSIVLGVRKRKIQKKGLAFPFKELTHQWVQYWHESNQGTEVRSGLEQMYMQGIYKESVPLFMESHNQLLERSTW